jgi:hypothetical protein
MITALYLSFSGSEGLNQFRREIYFDLEFFFFLRPIIILISIYQPINQQIFIREFRALQPAIYLVSLFSFLFSNIY